MGMENVFVYGAFFGTLVLFFPIFLSLDAYTDLTKNKTFFSVHLFKFIKIFGGYILLHTEGIAIHLTKKKAIFIRYEDMQNEQKKFEITAGFQLFTLRTSLELSIEKYPLAAFYTAALAQVLSQIIYPLVSYRKEFMNLKNGTLLTQGEGIAKATVHLVTVFNQLTIGMALSKIILEAIINLWQKKKNTKQLKT